MEEQKVTFEVAKLAKEKGFDIPCNYYFYTPDALAMVNKSWKSRKITFEENHVFGQRNRFFKGRLYDRNHYNTTISIPTQSLLQRWLREIHSIHIEVLPRYQPKKLNTEDVLYSWAISVKPFDVHDGHNDVLNHWIGIHDGEPYTEDIFYHVVNTFEEALEIGLHESLKLIVIK